MKERGTSPLSLLTLSWVFYVDFSKGQSNPGVQEVKGTNQGRRARFNNQGFLSISGGTLAR